MLDLEGELARANAFRSYCWRLMDYAQSAGYQRLAQEIALSKTNFQGNLQWENFLACLALVETFERRAWFRAAERTVYYLSMSKARVTLGPFQMQDAPWRTSDAVQMVISKLLENGINPSFCDENLSQLASFWYGHAVVESGAAFSYSDAMRAAQRVIAKIS